MMNGWFFHYELCQKYFEHYGNIDIPQKFITKNGVDYDSEGVKLGYWIRYQRENYFINHLSSEKIALLEKLHMSWDVRSSKWEQYYSLAQAYYQYHHNLNVPRSFCTHNGYEYAEDGVKLGSWIQRQCHSKLSKEQIDKLNELGMLWNNHEVNWYNNYLLAQNFYNYHHHLNIPRKFITQNGYEESTEGIDLGSWLVYQKQKYLSGLLSENKINLLNNLKIIWTLRIDSWYNNYHLLEKFKEYYHHLNVPYNFVTENGYEVSSKGINLNSWLLYQRKLYSNDLLSMEKVNLLEELGIIWHRKKNEKEVINTCLNYHIDYELNKLILKNISNRELICKIKYLLDHSLNITDNGLLHNIFSMSNQDLLDTYGISLKEILSEYDLKESRG